MKKIKAFTVAEILITAAIIGVLAVLFVVGARMHGQSAWLKSRDYKLGVIKYESVYNSINASYTKQLMENSDYSEARKVAILNKALNSLNSVCKGVKCNFAGFAGNPSAPTGDPCGKCSAGLRAFLKSGR